jgi:DNA-binding NtrC family response regulator
MSEPFGQDTISVPVRRALAPPCSVIALRPRHGGARLELPLDRRRWLVGKAPSCDIILPDPHVSAVHCVLERRADGALRVRDCDSKNGTIVDGQAVIAMELRPGAVLVLGRTTLVAEGAANPHGALAQLRGADPHFRAALELALRAARSDCSVLIVGETGTGKDLVARAIHEASRRAFGPFVPINCGAFPRELIGAELFGHARGAFTGAVEAREGVVAAADGGTLFLDELGELSLDLQPHLLRVLETRRVRPVGGIDERPVDVRFVAATNRTVGAGPDASLRADLYHRVAAVVVQMPPLRARRADLPDLVAAFLAELAAHAGPRELLPAALDALLAHDWPGNVRELRQTIERAVSLTTETIDAPDLRLPARRGPYERAEAPPRLARGSLPPPLPGLRAMDQADPADGVGRADAVLREMMVQALARCGTIRGAARALGIPKSTFSDKARRFGLVPGRGDE